jgi:hypothetical protein
MHTIALVPSRSTALHEFCATARPRIAPIGLLILGIWAAAMFIITAYGGADLALSVAIGG